MIDLFQKSMGKHTGGEQCTQRKQNTRNSQRPSVNMANSGIRSNQHNYLTPLKP